MNEPLLPTPPAPSDDDKIFPDSDTFLKNRGDPPPWRRYERADAGGETHVVTDAEREAVRAAFYLRRPLLVTGDPGVGKSSLARAIAAELGLGPVLTWPITSRSVLLNGLYSYDAVGRFQEKNQESGAIGKYLSLGPLGTGLADSTRDLPRVVLIDEIDKSDVDLPNDLLHVLEEGSFVIPELERYHDHEADVEVALHGGDGRKKPIHRGLVKAEAAPFILMTSNGEREFPPAFLRRCLRLRIQRPTSEILQKVMRRKLVGHLPSDADLAALVEIFLNIREGPPSRALATDQLLNAAFLVAAGEARVDRAEMERLLLEPLQ